MNIRRQSWKAICLLSFLGLGLLFIGIRTQHRMMLNAALIAAVNQGSVKQANDLLTQGADADTAVPWFRSVPPSLEQWYWFRWSSGTGFARTSATRATLRSRYCVSPQKSTTARWLTLCWCMVQMSTKEAVMIILRLSTLWVTRR